MMTLSITEVCRRTGLSARALRFYEARGLVSAQRSAAGQRRYGASEVARLHQVTALKRAGFSLAQVGALIGGGVDLARLIAAQVDDLRARRARLDEALAGLDAAARRLAKGEALDLDTLCTLIKQGETTMTTEADWKKVADRYFSPGEQDRWRAKMAAVPGDFDQAAYQAKWADLGSRIAADLPLDPASATAQAYLDEWQALLAPFNAVADAKMKADVVGLYDRMGEWSGDASPGFDTAVWAFVRAAGAARARAEK